MKQLSLVYCIPVLLLLGAGASDARADGGAFKACVDGSNYGTNTSSLIVSQVFNRIDCDERAADDAERVLARAVKRFVLTTSDSRDVKVCVYRGLFYGYIATLAREYAQCNGRRFNRLSLESVALAAEAVFVALVRALGPSSDAVQSAFDLERAGAVDLVDAAEEIAPGGCARVIEGEASLDFDDGVGEELEALELTPELRAIVCADYVGI